MSYLGTMNDFQKVDQALGKIEDTVCDKTCVGVMATSYFLSCDKTQSSLVDEILGREFMTIEFLLGDLPLSRYGGFRESHSDIPAIFQ